MSEMKKKPNTPNIHGPVPKYKEEQIYQKSQDWLKIAPQITNIYDTAQKAYAEGDFVQLDSIMKTSFQHHQLYDIISVAAHVGRRFGEDAEYNKDPDLAQSVINSNSLSLMVMVLHILENEHRDEYNRSIYTDK